MRKTWLASLPARLWISLSKQRRNTTLGHWTEGGQTQSGRCLSSMEPMAMMRSANGLSSGCSATARPEMRRYIGCVERRHW